jgi:hypothetical protein
MSNNSQHVLDWRKRIRTAIVQAMGGCCQICGYNACERAFDLHHIDPSLKDQSISSMISSPRKWMSIALELVKCVLLCVRCHREVHAGFAKLPDAYKIYGGELEKWYEFKRQSLLKNQMDVCPVCSQPKHISLKTCSVACRITLRKKIDWPSPDALSKLVWERPTVQIARELGVSDKAVEKHCKKLGIAKPGLGYWRQVETFILRSPKGMAPPC